MSSADTIVHGYGTIQAGQLDIADTLAFRGNETVADADGNPQDFMHAIALPANTILDRNFGFFLPDIGSSGLNVGSDDTGCSLLVSGYANVGQTELQDESVAEDKIVDAAVTENKIGSGAVTSAKIGASAVTSDKMDLSSDATSYSFASGILEIDAKWRFAIDGNNLVLEYSSDGGSSWTAKQAFSAS
tara:strand:+ start:7865 stop:8428 length:564 start_codon:yes stop_codon:yes gene_type:complete